MSLIDEYEERLNKLTIQKRLLALKITTQLKLLEKFIEIAEEGADIVGELRREADRLKDLLYGSPYREKGYFDVIEEIDKLKEEIEEMRNRFGKGG